MCKSTVTRIGIHNALWLERSLHQTVRAVTHPNYVMCRKSIIDVFSAPRKQVFFGYYDISPFSSNGKYLLANHAPQKNVRPASEDRITLGYYDLQSAAHEFVELGETTTWCWQQGCRLQWYPAHSNDQVIYNRLVDGKYGCEIQNIHTKEVLHKYSRPIYSVSQDGKWGLSLNFSRLQRLRPGYGYMTLPDPSEGISAPTNDGIWHIDMETGNEELLFSIHDIMLLKPAGIFANGEHYFNHICFNPDGNRFMFFHLCKENSRRMSRLLTADINGDNTCILEDERTVSHYTWKTNTELLVTSSQPGSAGLQYRLYKDIHGENYVVGQNILNEDGHPSYLPNQDYILTDTYPDKCGDRKLLLYNTKKHTLLEIANFDSPLSFKGEVRCDLHPRLSHCGKLVCADIVYKGKRSMVVTSIENICSKLQNDPPNEFTGVQ